MNLGAQGFRNTWLLFPLSCICYIFTQEEERKCLYNTLYKELTETERQVFDLRMSGFEYKEICIILNKSYKSVDSALQRIKLKVKKVLRDID